MYRTPWPRFDAVLPNSIALFWACTMKMRGMLLIFFVLIIHEKVCNFCSILFWECGAHLLRVYLHIVGGLRAHSTAKDGPTKLWFSDDSSLFTVLCQPFLARGMFFQQNKCLEWIQNYNKPLVWPLTCYLNHTYFCVLLSCSKVNGTPTLSGRCADPEGRRLGRLN